MKFSAFTLRTAPAAATVAAAVTAGGLLWASCLCAGVATGQSLLPLPDFQPDQQYLAQTMFLDYVDADLDPCLRNEGCLSGPGMRRVLRFGTKIHNIGAADAVLGRPPDVFSPANPPYWHWDTCHKHWHFTAYAKYALYPLDDQNRPIHSAAPRGSKNGFCLEDLECPVGLAKKYTCALQGVTAGCADVYDSSLKCQWIDITDLLSAPQDAARKFQLMVTINGDGFFPESDLSNNEASVVFSFDQVPERWAGAGQPAPVAAPVYAVGV
ncbi:Lysyl oxidase-domain-containing protein [Zopfochytrium polystomum]|nr:Lysyl oxidase-domain-containing protein [Zopfochytrium polystomum]